MWHLTLTKAHLTVTADDQGREYGDANPSFTHVTTAFKNGQREGLRKSGPGVSSAAPATSPVPGPYDITCSGGASGNYDFAYVKGHQIGRASRRERAEDDQGREYGDANPSFTHVTTGFKNGESEAALTTVPSCTSAATATSPVPGPHDITCSGGASGTYDVAYVKRHLTLTKSTLAVTRHEQTQRCGDQH